MLKAAHYETTVEKLVADPVMIALANEAPSGAVINRGGAMLALLRAYNAAGGTVETHIGGPLEAVEILRPDITFEF